MRLRYVRLHGRSAELPKVKRLFESAFPPEERPPFEMMLTWEKNLFFAVYDAERFVALVDLIHYQDLVYVFFLAVEDSFRGKGYGTKILQDLLNEYPSERLYLLADEVGPSYADNEVRKRRIRFYDERGFHYQGIKVRELGVWYQMMVARGEVSKEEFVATMTYLIGEEMAAKYYADV